MRPLLLTLALLASNCYSAEKWQSILASETQTSLGKLVVEHPTGQSSVEIRLNGKVISGLGEEYFGASLSDVIRIAGHELVVISLDSGGIACPAEFAVLEVTPQLRISEVFGNCNPSLRLLPKDNSLRIDMPAYFANPELLSTAEKRGLGKKIDRYVWMNGKVKSIRSGQ